jgi:hypothetical protein
VCQLKPLELAPHVGGDEKGKKSTILAIVFNISIIYTSIRRYYNFEE